MARTSSPSIKASPLGRRIRRLRDESGLTQVALAKASGLGRATIAHIETGFTTSINSVTLTRLAKGLRVTVATILSPHKTHRGATRKSAA